MSVRISVRVRTEAVRKNLSRLFQEADRAGDRTLITALEGARQALATPPPTYAGKPEHYWASAAQRAFVMLNIAFPYTRTGELESSWTIEAIKNGYRLSSSHPYAKFVVGTARSPEAQYYLHRGRWITMRQAVEDAIADLPVEIQESVYTVARRRGFTAT